MSGKVVYMPVEDACRPHPQPLCKPVGLSLVLHRSQKLLAGMLFFLRRWVNLLELVDERSSCPANRARFCVHVLGSDSRRVRHGGKAGFSRTTN